MTISPLSKKLLIKPGCRLLLINAPENYITLLDPMPDGSRLYFEAEGYFDVLQLFVISRAALKEELTRLQGHLRDDTVFWITYPKKSSGISSDLEMTNSWDETSVYGLSPVASAAINETWTALRFRPEDQIKRSSGSNSAIQNSSLAQYIDVKNRTVTFPDDIRSVIGSQPAAIAFFESLSYTNKKEYMTWMITAKQEKTRKERIAKTLEKLILGKKNPSEK